MAQEKLERSHTCVNYNGNQRPSHNGQSEVKVTYKRDFKRVGSR